MQNDPYRAVNDRLVEIFERQLDFAKRLKSPPDANETEELICELTEELRAAIKD